MVLRCNRQEDRRSTWPSILHAHQPAHGVIEIGNILWGPGIARTRVATEALYLFARYAFETLGYRRLEWKCDSLEQAIGRRAALRFDFSSKASFVSTW